MNSGFSIIIGTVKKLDYLSLCLDSLKENSYFKDHEVIIHFSNFDQECQSFAEFYGIKKYTSSKGITGICSAINMAAELATKDDICIIDDDMYLLPDWDKEIVDFKKTHKLSDLDWVCSTMIEPPNYFYGPDPRRFNQPALMADLNQIKQNISAKVSTQSTPLLVDRLRFLQIGGYDKDFDPAPGAEDSFAKKFYDMGCRNFVNCPTSLVYHFQSTTINSQILNYSAVAKRRDENFIKKYGLTIKEFNKLIDRGEPWTKK